MREQPCVRRPRQTRRRTEQIGDIHHASYLASWISNQWSSHDEGYPYTGLIYVPCRTTGIEGNFHSRRKSAVFSDVDHHGVICCRVLLQPSRTVYCGQTALHQKIADFRIHGLEHLIAEDACGGLVCPGIVGTREARGIRSGDGKKIARRLLIWGVVVGIRHGRHPGLPFGILLANPVHGRLGGLIRDIAPLPTLHKSGTHVHVEDMQCLVRSKRQICHQDSARLTPLRDLDVFPCKHRQSAECQVAVGAAPQRAGPEACCVLWKRSRDLPSLIEQRSLSGSIHHLLQTQQVRVQLPQD